MKTLIVCDGVIHRTAGFRAPEPGELYLNASGGVSLAQNDVLAVNRTILRTVHEEHTDAELLECRRLLIQAVAYAWEKS